MRIYVLALLLVACGSKAPSDLKAVGAPVGEVSGKLKITVTFSRAMVTQAQTGKLVATPPATIEPALATQAMWLDEKTLLMTGTEDLPLSTNYQVTVPKHTKALDGNELPDDMKFSFFTERLTAAFDVLGSAAHSTRDQLVRVTFNQYVALDQVFAHCRYTTGDDHVELKNGPESPSGPAKSYTLAPKTQLTLDK